MIVEEFKSDFSGKIEVKKIWEWGWKYYVTVGNLTQSGGLINDLWGPVIKNCKLKIKNCLILGLATGTLAKLINKKYKNIKITGVEIDPVMIRIGKKYSGLDKIPNLKIKNEDAYSYIINHNSKFDTIFVDLYLGENPPSFLYTDAFLKKLHKSGKKVVINHLFYDDFKKKKAGELIKKLEKIFKDIKLQRVLTNIMIICE